VKIVVSYRGIPGRPGWATGDMVSRAFRRMGHAVWSYGTVYQTSSEIQPCPWEGGVDAADMVVSMECGDGDRQYLELGQRRPGLPLVMWDFDTALHIEKTIELAAKLRADAVALANGRFLHNLAFLGYRPVHLPYAVDPALFHPLPGVERSGAAIIGSLFGPRATFAGQAGIRLINDVYGPAYVGAINGLLVHVHAYSSAGPGLVVMRPWETLGCGVCLLTEADPALEQSGLTPGVHLATYDGPDDARAQVNRLLEDGEAREALAWQGLRHVLDNHTYDHRAAALLELVK